MIELLVTSLALWQAIEVWHHGEIFAAARAYFRSWPASRRSYVRWPGKLINCMFCLSLWVGAMLVVATTLWPDAVAVRLVVWSLAVTRLAQLGNDVTHHWNRSPPADFVPLDEQLEFNDQSGEVTPDLSNSIAGYSNGPGHEKNHGWKDYGPP